MLSPAAPAQCVDQIRLARFQAARLSGVARAVATVAPPVECHGRSGGWRPPPPTSSEGSARQAERTQNRQIFSGIRAALLNEGAEEDFGVALRPGLKDRPVAQCIAAIGGRERVPELTISEEQAQPLRTL
ncbi:unnamed protein product, partial [Prorocentrum cordatum]